MSALRSPSARLGLIVALVLTIALVVFGFRPERVRVEIAPVGERELVESLREEGQTRVVHRHRISATVAGEVERIDWRPGDAVSAGTVLARVLPAAGALLDPANRERLRNESRAAGFAVQQAQARVNASVAADSLAQQELARLRPLLANGSVSVRELDRADSLARQARADLAAARFALDLAKAQAAAAESLLAQPGRSGSAEEPVAILAPVDGIVLARLRESAGPVAVGEALLEMGDPTALEVAVDLLSSDAVRIAAGMEVLLHRWGGALPLQARVRRVEPVGFTKISALGVEEQRVWVLADFESPPQEWQRLGDGYRVEAEFVLSRGRSLAVPASALFRRGDNWAVFAVRDGQAQEQAVQTGRRGGLYVEVLGGVQDGDQVVLHPDDRVRPGARVLPVNPGQN